MRLQVRSPWIMAHVLPIAASFFQPHSLSHALLTKVITKGGSAEVYTSGSAASDAIKREYRLALTLGR